jgi:precorrin-2/cobalt-factor-2 C20-methyltransferase
LKLSPGLRPFAPPQPQTNRALVEGDEILSIIPATASKRLMEMALDATNSVVFMKVYNQKDKVLDVIEMYDLLDSSILVQK